MKKRILSSVLVIIMLLSMFVCNVTVFAGNTSSLSYLDGLIISNTENEFQFLTLSGNIKNINPEMQKDIKEFCKVIANQGIKVSAIANTYEQKENTIQILGMSTAKELPAHIEEIWKNYVIDNYGEYFIAEGVITETDGVYSFVTEDKIYSPITCQYVSTEDYAKILANTGVKVKIESAAFRDNSLLISYMQTVNKVPKEIEEALDAYRDEQLEKNSKRGVIVSSGTDSYIFVEKDTNKMYPITTSITSIYVAVPVLADRGYEVVVGGTIINEKANILDLYALKTGEGVPESVYDEIMAADKKRFESIYFNVEGYITLDNETDYNVHFNTDEVLGLETTNADVAKFIKAVANDTTVKLLLEGYINYDETVMDVRNITLLEDIPDGETKNKLMEAFPTTENKTNNTQTQTNNNLLSQNSSTSSTTNTSDVFSLLNSSNFSNLLNSAYGTSDLSSLFANSNLTSMFSSTFGDTSSFMNAQSLYDSFNTQLQTQSGLLNGGNLSNFDMEAFMETFNSIANNSANLNTQTNQENTNTDTNTSTTETSDFANIN